MDKKAILALIIARLEAELAAIRAAALATHAEATHEENKAEDKYDTRGLEASYLAHGQSQAAQEAAAALAQFQALAPRDFGPGEPISLGALVVLGDRAASTYLIGPRAGGTEIDCAGRTVMVVTPQSPLGRQLLGRKQGDGVTLEAAGRRTAVTVTAVT